MRSSSDSEKDLPAARYELRVAPHSYSRMKRRRRSKSARNRHKDNQKKENSSNKSKETFVNNIRKFQDMTNTARMDVSAASVTQNRLTMRCGVFSHEKSSGSIMREKLSVPKSVQEKTDAAIKNILNPCDSDTQPISTEAATGPGDLKLHYDHTGSPDCRMEVDQMSTPATSTVEDRRLPQSPEVVEIANNLMRSLDLRPFFPNTDILQETRNKLKQLMSLTTPEMSRTPENVGSNGHMKLVLQRQWSKESVSVSRDTINKQDLQQQSGGRTGGAARPVVVENITCCCGEIPREAGHKSGSQHKSPQHHTAPPRLPCDSQELMCDPDNVMDDFKPQFVQSLIGQDDSPKTNLEDLSIQTETDGKIFLALLESQEESEHSQRTLAADGYTSKVADDSSHQQVRMAVTEPMDAKRHIRQPVDRSSGRQVAHLGTGDDSCVQIRHFDNTVHHGATLDPRCRNRCSVDLDTHTGLHYQAGSNAHGEHYTVNLDVDGEHRHGVSQQNQGGARPRIYTETDIMTSSKAQLYRDSALAAFPKTEAVPMTFSALDARRHTDLHLTADVYPGHNYMLRDMGQSHSLQDRSHGFMLRDTRQSYPPATHRHTQNILRQDILHQLDHEIMSNKSPVSLATSLTDTIAAVAGQTRRSRRRKVGVQLSQGSPDTDGSPVWNPSILLPPPSFSPSPQPKFYPRKMY